jgi:hypothetical protein
VGRHRLRVLRRILGLKTKGVIGGLRKFHNEEFPRLYSTPNIIRVRNQGK